MIVRMPKPSMRYAVTTCLDSLAASSLGARRPSFSNAAQRDGDATGAAAGAGAGSVGAGMSCVRAFGGAQVTGAAGAGAPGDAVVGANGEAGEGNALRGVAAGIGGRSG